MLTPDQFLPLLGADDRLALFGVMLGESIALIRSLGPAAANLYVSINVEISLVASDDFVDVLHYFLDRYGFDGENLVLELLENEDIKDLSRLKACLSQVKALGLQLALDDVGTGYASMTRMRELPIDMFKLDPRLRRRPRAAPDRAQLHHEHDDAGARHREDACRRGHRDARGLRRAPRPRHRGWAGLRHSPADAGRVRGALARHAPALPQRSHADLPARRLRQPPHRRRDLPPPAGRNRCPLPGCPKR